MAIFKCKMCGGALEITGNESVIECEYCGTKQTLPKLDDEKRANLYDRANHFRRNNEFDKAMGIYEQILNEDNTDAEAYWSLVLCRYGIEYVEDPATKKRVPTVNRAQFTSIFDDEDYKSALLNADSLQKAIYEAEAKTINEIQKGILEISGKEEPFDVFICYKETDASGRRTPDSVLATDLYHQLTQEGFKVFFSRITLEDKLGQEYEPYIFAALNSSKVMVALGTKPEYFKAVWVKNEWSRYLALIKKGEKKMLIPAYKDMDPYDLPEEFSHLQAQDMAKLGFMQDLIRGIKKIIASDEPKTTVVKETVVTESAGTNTAPLIRRMFMFLEDGEWNSANEYAEKVLDIEPECAEAYLGKLMAEKHAHKKDELKNCETPFVGNSNYNKVMRFGSDAIKAELSGYIDFINDRNKKAKIEAERRAEEARLEAERKAEEARKENIYQKAISKMLTNLTFAYNSAIELFESIPGYKDSAEKIEECKKKISEIEAKQEAERIEAERRAEESRVAAEKKKKAIIKVAKIATPIVCVIVAFIILMNSVILPMINYNKGVKKIADGDITGGVLSLIAADGYKDSEDLVREHYAKARFAEFASAGYYHTVGLKSDGTVVAVGYNEDGQCNVAGWKDIIAVSAGYLHTVGLKSDGTVVAVGDNYYGQCDVAGWKDIIAVSAGNFHTVGLKSDGTVVAVGDNDNGQCDVAGWKDIIAVSAGSYHTVGLKSDGTAVAVGSDNYGRCDVAGWKDIIAVSVGYDHTVGLKSDGTVVAVGDNYYGQCDVAGWKDIIAVSAGYRHTVGLKSDGTVVAVGDNDDGQCDVAGWKDIIAVSAGSYHTVGLKSDGTVVAVEYNDDGQCDVAGWDLF